MKRLIPAALAALLVLSLAACTQTQASNPSGNDSTDASAQSTQNSTPENETVQVIYIAHAQAGRPMNFVNDQGESDGYEVQVMREIGALLPQYEFEFVPTSDDDLLIGLETGRYQAATKGAWYTEERAEKFLFPQYYYGASSIGLLMRTDYAESISGLYDFAAADGRLVPISPSNAQYNVILEYNEDNPENPVTLEPADVFQVVDAYQWVLEGRYDAYFTTKTGYESNVLYDDAPYGQFKDDFTYVVHRSLPCWAMFNKTQQELADACDEAYQQLLESGRIEELMLEYLGENTFDTIR